VTHYILQRRSPLRRCGPAA